MPEQGVINQIGTEKTFFVLNSNLFDSIATAYLGRQYNFVEVHEANNYSSYQFTVSPNDITYFLAHLPTNGILRSPREVLTAMVADGIIQTGNYLIEVYW